MKKRLLDYAPLLGLALAVIGLDQWTKYMVRTRIPFGGIWSPWEWLLPYARIVHWNNRGAAFGMFQSFGDVFTVLAIIVAIAILYYYPQVPRRDWPLRLAMGMQLGGAVGNLIDRLTIGSVTDFISVGNFAVFNVADASISVGVAVLVIGMWIKDRQEQKEKSSQPQDPPAADPADQSPAPDPLPKEAKGE